MRLPTTPGPVTPARTACANGRVHTPRPDKPIQSESAGWHSSHPALWPRYIVWDGAIVDVDEPIEPVNSGSVESSESYWKAWLQSHHPRSQTGKEQP